MFEKATASCIVVILCWFWTYFIVWRYGEGGQYLMSQWHLRQKWFGDATLVHYGWVDLLNVSIHNSQHMIGSLFLWHSKADKIVNNFIVKHTFLWSKMIFCSQVLQTFLVSLHCIPITKFHAQNPFHSNDRTSCSKPISIPILCSTPFCWGQPCLSAYLCRISTVRDLTGKWEQLQR